MSELRSALDEMGVASNDDLSIEELRDQIVELVYCNQRVDVLVAEKTRALADRGGHHDLGYSSPTNFLSDVGRMTPGHARQVIYTGLAKDKAPLAFQAWADGRLSTDQARHLFRAAEAVPDSYPAAEGHLVDIVEGLDPVDTGKAVEYWRQSVDGPGNLDSETRWARQGLSTSWTVAGMLKVDGWLTPLAGEAFLAGIEANNPPRNPDDHRTPRQRRHDALENLCRDWLDNGTTPTVGGEKPHIDLLCDLPALQAIAGGLHETLDGQILTIDTLRMVACDCSLTRIVVGPQGEILDVGRKTRVWTTAQRKAIIARDQHCQGKGCRTSWRHCDIHHLDHWADGGETSIDKGILYCRPCHTQEHHKDHNQRHRRRTQG